MPKPQHRYLLSYSSDADPIAFTASPIDATYIAAALIAAHPPRDWLIADTVRNRHTYCRTTGEAMQFLTN